MISGLAFALLGACTGDSPTEPLAFEDPLEGPLAAVVAADNVDDLAVAAATDSTVTLRWTQVHNGAGKPASYRLKYATPPFAWSGASIGCSPTINGTQIGAAMSCTVVGLTTATTYDFQLMSFRLSSTGAWQGAVYSNLITGATTAPAVADAVADLAIVAATDSSLTVRWTQVGGGTGQPASYRLKYARPPIDWATASIGCNPMLAGTQIGGQMSCTIEGLAASTAYDLQLMAFRVSSSGAWEGATYSNPTTGQTAAPPDADVVADLAIVAATDSSLSLRWTQVEDGNGLPASYRVRYAGPPIDWNTATAGCASAIAGTSIGTQMSCTIESLSAATPYDVQVMSYRVEGTASAGAAYSNVAEAQTAAPPAPPAPPGSGIWISTTALAQLPMSGAAWNSLLAEANGSCGVVVLSDQDQNNNVCIMAKALVFARTGNPSYRTAVVTALTQIVGSAVYSGRALALGRELGAYVISADLIQLRTFSPTLDTAFRAVLRTLRTTLTLDGPASLVECHERRPNNWGTHCGGTRAAIAAYLGDTAELDRVAKVFKGWLGDRSSYAGFSYGDLSWQCDPARPVGINPAGCARNGQSIDGVLADDQRRAGGFVWPAPKENYVWEALQGALMQAVILHRAGYPVWDWENRALLRAVTWLYNSNNYPAAADDTWQPHVINHFYGTNFPAPLPARAGKNVGWTDWTH